jgi:hypothetical protein
MFLHIYYSPHDKKNRVTTIENANISFQKNSDIRSRQDMRILFENEKLSFAMFVNDITYITNDDNGKMHLSVSGLDRKNRKVKVYTDTNDKKFVREGKEDPYLFIAADMADAFADYKEI